MSDEQLKPKIPYKFEIPQYNDMEERLKHLFAFWGRIFFTGIFVLAVLQTYVTMLYKPKEKLTDPKLARLIFLKEVVKNSLDPEITKPRTISGTWSRRSYICDMALKKSRENISSKYLGGPRWMSMDRKFIINKGDYTCEFAQQLYYQIFSVCKTTKCVQDQYLKIKTYAETNDMNYYPEVQVVNVDQVYREHKDIIKMIFIHAGWYLGQKGDK